MLKPVNDPKMVLATAEADATVVTSLKQFVESISGPLLFSGGNEKKELLTSYLSTMDAEDVLSKFVQSGDFEVLLIELSKDKGTVYKDP